MEYIIALLAITLVIALIYLKNVFSYWTNLGIPQFPVTVPYGNIKGMMKEYHMSQFLIEYYQKTKNIGSAFSGIYMFTRPVLMITDLELIKMVLVKDFNVFPNRGFYVKIQVAI